MKTNEITSNKKAGDDGTAPTIPDVCKGDIKQ
jgi:hypothetical protein